MSRQHEHRFVWLEGSRVRLPSLHLNRLVNGEFDGLAVRTLYVDGQKVRVDYVSHESPFLEQRWLVVKMRLSDIVAHQLAGYPMDQVFERRASVEKFLIKRMRVDERVGRQEEYDVGNRSIWRWLAALLSGIVKSMFGLRS